MLRNIYQEFRRSYGSRTAILDPAMVTQDAEAVMKCATQTFDRIMSQRADMDKDGRQNEPLVVAVGERHDTISHYLHNMVVLDMLKRAEPLTTFGREYPHNYVLSMIDSCIGFPVSAGLEPVVNHDNQDGTVGLNAKLSAPDDGSYAPQSSYMMMHSIFESNIRAHFNDVSRQQSFIDPNDPQTVQSLRDCFNEAASISLNALSPEMMQARNYHMARLIAHDLDAKPSRIYYQTTGGLHVLGCLSDDLHYDTSLTRYLHCIPGIDVIPVLLDECVDIAPQTRIDSGLLQHTKLPDLRSECGDMFLDEGETSSAHIQTQELENEYLKAIMGALNLGRYYLSCDQIIDVSNQHAAHFTLYARDLMY